MHPLTPPTRTALFAAAILLLLPAVAMAQRADSATAAVKPAPRAVRDSSRLIQGPPISPRRALLYSLLVPGLGQAKLDRPNAGALYVMVEAVSLAMAHKSSRSVRAAEQAEDSIIVRYNPPTTAGGNPVPVYELSQLKARVRSRKTQVEDWVAVLLFNHFFSGADAFVAAQLWDLPTILKAESRGAGAAVTARIYW